MISAVCNKVSGASSGADVDQAAAARGAEAHIAGMVQRKRCQQGSPAHLAVAKSYMDARLSNNIGGVLAALSPNVRLTSQRDGTVTGHAGVQQYLQKVGPEGEWGRPYLDQQTGLVRFDGRIKIAKVIPVTVKGMMLFGQDGKIEEIFVGKA